MAKVYTTKEAAKALGLEVSHVRRLLIQKKLDGRKWGRDWQVLSLDYTPQKALKGTGKRYRGVNKEIDNSIERK